MLIIKGALNAPLMHRRGSLQWVLMGAPGETQKSHFGDSPRMGNPLKQGIPLQIPKRAVFHFLFWQDPPLLGKPTPAPPGWLASRGQGHCLTRATLAAANLARDSADSDRDGLQVVVALFVKPASSEAWGLGGGCCTGQTPYQHLSGIYRHRSHAQSFQCKPVRLL